MSSRQRLLFWLRANSFICQHYWTGQQVVTWNCNSIPDWHFSHDSHRLLLLLQLILAISEEIMQWQSDEQQFFYLTLQGMWLPEKLSGYMFSERKLYWKQGTHGKLCVCRRRSRVTECGRLFWRERSFWWNTNSLEKTQRSQYETTKFRQNHQFVCCGLFILFWNYVLRIQEKSRRGKQEKGKIAADWRKSWEETRREKRRHESGKAKGDARSCTQRKDFCWNGKSSKGEGWESQESGSYFSEVWTKLRWIESCYQLCCLEKGNGPFEIILLAWQKRQWMILWNHEQVLPPLTENLMSMWTHRTQNGRESKS